MFPVFLHCPFLIAFSVFSNVYLGIVIGSPLQGKVFIITCKVYNTARVCGLLRTSYIANPYNLRTLCMTVIILVVGTFRLSFTFFISETQPQYFTMSIQCNPVKGLGCVWCLTTLSTIFQLYCSNRFYWWRKPEFLE
jgi:hypothetical protein